MQSIQGVLNPSRNSSRPKKEGRHLELEDRLPEIYDLVDQETVSTWIFKATLGSTVAVFAMMGAVYASAEEIEYLRPAEQDAAKIAVYMMGLSMVFLIGPFFFDALKGKSDTFNTIVISGLLVSFSALWTNLFLAYFPTVVRVSPIVGSRVYLIRWCEWIPLAGLMTFMADCITTTRRNGLFVPVLVGLSQLASTINGILFPFTESVFIFTVLMFWALATYMTLFPRVWYKYTILRDTNWELYEPEIFERHKFGLQLLGLCTVVWTILVIMFFVNFGAIHTLPASHILRHEAFPMFVDGIFDVVAKGLYTRLIVDIYYAAFCGRRFT